MIMRPIVVASTAVLLSFSLAFSQSPRPAADTFRVKMLIAEGANWKAKDAMLNFEQNRIVLRAAKDDFKTVSMTYNEISGAEYSHSADPQKIPTTFALIANVFALPWIARKADSHWLTVKSETSEASITLDETNYRDVVAAFQDHVGQKVTGWNVATASARR